MDKHAVAEVGLDVAEASISIYESLLVSTSLRHGNLVHP
jgi:hypothetical protein